MEVLPTPISKINGEAKPTRKTRREENPISKVDGMEKPAEKKSLSKKQKAWLAIGVALAVAVIAIVVAYFALRKEDSVAGDTPEERGEPVYSLLTGEEIASSNLNSSPIFCAQIANGADGRPQAGLTQAAVVFEAIAEAGITRFAAVFQNANASAIGPVRSLRPYYLEWDLPFDCTVVHAGGSDEAIANLNASGARNMDESLQYMWRETGTNRNWNNLFTSASGVHAWNVSHGYTSSSPKVFPRLTPDEAAQIIAARNQCPEGEVCENAAPQNPIKLGFSASQNYNTVYNYDPETNSYFRSFASGDQHLVYDCPADLNQPNTKTACGGLVQLHPNVVIAMVVRESRASDNYHENITTTGSGNATIFQNGEAIEGTWQKTSARAQLVFRDTSGNEIKLAPGQLWIAAIPQYGSVSY